MSRVIAKNKRLARRKFHIRKNIFGTAERPRMSVYRSNQHMYVQVIDDNAGHTLVSASTMEAELKGLKNKIGRASCRERV